jgi:hypothetical protein
VFTVPLGSQIKLHTPEEQASLISYRVSHENLTRFSKFNFEYRQDPVTHPVSCNFSLQKEDEVQFVKSQQMLKEVVNCLLTRSKFFYPDMFRHMVVSA